MNKISATTLRDEIISKALDFMNTNIKESITLKDICDQVYTSRRSLIYAFTETFGIGPITYLKRQRLNNVRRVLLKANPQSTKVENIAYEWGFLHLGNFASDYQKMFGEKPSQTLRNITTSSGDLSRNCTKNNTKAVSIAG